MTSKPVDPPLTNPNPELDKLWQRASSNPGQRVEIGRLVICDLCNGDYTDRPDSGGFIVQSSAHCPACASGSLAVLRRFHETHFIRARCPDGQSFADFVREYRNASGSTYIQITTR